MGLLCLIPLDDDGEAEVIGFYLPLSASVAAFCSPQRASKVHSFSPNNPIVLHDFFAYSRVIILQIL